MFVEQEMVLLGGMVLMLRTVPPFGGLLHPLGDTDWGWGERAENGNAQSPASYILGCHIVVKGRKTGRGERNRWSMGLQRRLEVATLLIGVGSPGDGRLWVVQVARIHQGHLEALRWLLLQPFELGSSVFFELGTSGQVGRDWGAWGPVREAAG